MVGTRSTQATTLDPRAYRLPDIPEKHPDDMTSSKHLAKGGNQGRLEVHLGDPETTIVSGERFIQSAPSAPTRYPDLLVAFDSDPDLYEANNGYIVSHQGKPPDFVLEIASRYTGHRDIGEKVGFYAGLGVREYWRFDETGEFHGTRLAGDLLVNGQYQPIATHELPDGELRGYSEALGLYLCWRQGSLDWYDPAAEDYIPSLESERHLRRQAEDSADSERRLRRRAEDSADSERRLRRREQRLRLNAEKRIQELEERLRRRED